MLPSMSMERVIAELKQASEVYMLATGGRLATESMAERSSAAKGKGQQVVVGG
jgi:hypothetical protein